jgi:hypothetical protein
MTYSQGNEHSHKAFWLGVEYRDWTGFLLLPQGDGTLRESFLRGMARTSAGR